MIQSRIAVGLNYISIQNFQWQTFHSKKGTKHDQARLQRSLIFIHDETDLSNTCIYPSIFRTS